MSAHTPGPWTPHRTHDLWMEIYAGSPRWMVADCVRERDVHLVAAAPDMLAALEAARATLADHGQQDSDNWPTFQAVVAAIAKARQS